MNRWDDEHEDDRPQPRGVHDLGIRERAVVVGAVLACLLLGMLRTAAGIGGVGLALEPPTPTEPGIASSQAVTR